MKARLWGGCLGIAVLVTATMVAPATASAKRGYFAFPGYRESSLTLKGSHGYAIKIEASGRYIQLSAEQGPALALYIVEARKAAGDAIQATFPGRGRVDVEFHPTRPARHTSAFFPECRGGEKTTREGVFRGMIEFRGEQGFTEVHATRARGSIESAAREVCPRNDHDPSTDIATGGPPPPGYELTALDRSPGRELVFSAFLDTSDSPIPGGEVWLGAILRERRPGLNVFKWIRSYAPASSFTITGNLPKPSSASVAPPAPFRGSADFAADGKTASWDGSLEIDFPGDPGQKLAGPSFLASLCLNDEKCVGDR